MIIIETIYSAKRTHDDKVDFLVDAIVKGQEMKNVYFTYPNRSNADANSACVEWLQNNEPEAFVSTLEEVVEDDFTLSEYIQAHVEDALRDLLQ